MSQYRKIYLEWTIGDDSLLYSVPVGFEVEFSRDQHFHEITTTFSTFEEVSPYGSYRFWYSLDDGSSWVQYPWGEQGQSFTTPFLMRLEITPSDLGYTLSFFNGFLKKISADSKAIINSTVLAFEDNIIDANMYEDVLYLVGSKTLYKIDGRTLDPYDNSLPLLTDNAIGVFADESRKTFWQVNNTSVWLRSLYGDILWSASIPEINVDFSSSSSSSTSSSSSSSSTSLSSSSSTSSNSSGSSSSESSESVGNVSSSSSSSSSLSESSLGLPNLYASGFGTFTEFAGTYYAIGILDGYYIYHNANNCILQHDTYGVTRWKLYLNEANRALARDHYWKDAPDTSEPYSASNTYSIHMWWDLNPPTDTGTISDTP